MKQEQKPPLTLVRETMAQRLVSGSQQNGQPKPAGMVSGLIIRTEIKAGLLTALLLQQQAAAGATAGGGS